MRITGIFCVCLILLAIYINLFAVNSSSAQELKSKRAMLISTIEVWDGDRMDANDSAVRIREEIKLRYQMGYHLVESVSTDFNVTLVFEK